MNERLRRGLVPVLVTVLLVTVLLVGVFPTRTYFSQREAMAQSQSQLRDLEVTNAALQEEVEALESSARVEFLARQDFGMVRPGEEPYRILPPPKTPVPVPDVWPFTGLAELFAP